MLAAARKSVTTPIPVQLSECEFDQFILPYLSMPKRGPKCKLGYYRAFNLILRALYTGMQWKCLSVPIDSDGIGYSGHKHQRGEKIIAIIDNNEYILAPIPVAPVNEADTVLLPEGLKILKHTAKLTGLGRNRSYLNLVMRLGGMYVCLGGQVQAVVALL